MNYTDKCLSFPLLLFNRTLGDTLGHAWCGLLLARTFDPFLQTPVPLAFMAKMVLSIVMPLSSVKNQVSIA